MNFKMEDPLDPY